MIPICFHPVPLSADAALMLAAECRAYRAKARHARTRAIPRDLGRAMTLEKIARASEDRIRAYADSLMHCSPRDIAQGVDHA